MVIPAAGVGARMQRSQPKPFIQLAEKSILEHTLRQFLPLKKLQSIVVAASPAIINQAQDVLHQCLGSQFAWQCVEGGETRQQSINKALSHIKETDIVLVHDAVRPFIALDKIEACCNTAAEMGAAVVGFPAIDTIKKIDTDGMVVETPKRQKMWQIQTPQVFRTELLKKAYRQAESRGYQATDDASLVEWLGEPVKVVRGNRSNIKITYPQDLERARLLVENGILS